MYDLTSFARFSIQRSTLRFFTGCLAGIFGLLLASTATAEFRLADENSRVYFELGLLSGEDSQLEKGVRILGDVAVNGDLALKKDGWIDGKARVAGRATIQGSMTGELFEGVSPRVLPNLPDAWVLRTWADRVLDGDRTFENERLDDVVFVDGTVRIRGGLQGDGTLIATGDIRFDTVGGTVPAPPEAETRFSLIALGDIRVAKDWSLQAVLQAGRDVVLEKDTRVSGMIVAAGQVHLKKDALLRFTIFDPTPPTIEWISPSDPRVINDPTPALVFELLDDGTGIDPASFFLRYNGVVITRTCDVGPASATCEPPPMGSGVQQLEARIADGAGNTAVLSSEFEILLDTQPPFLNILRPLGGPVLARDAPTIELEYGDADSFARPEALQVMLDGTDVTASCIVEARRAVCSPLIGAGERVLTASIADHADNLTTAERRFDLVLDTVSPSLAWITPTDGAELFTPPDEAWTLILEYADALAGIDLGSLDIRVDDVSVTTDCEADTRSASCSLIGLEAGAHTIEATVADLVGNTGTVSSTVQRTLDGDAPQVEIISPSEPFFLGLSTVDVAISFSDSGAGIDPSAVRVRLGSRTLNCHVGADFATCPNVPITPGAQTVLADVADRAGNQATARVEFRVEPQDEIAPDLRITTPGSAIVRRDAFEGITLVYDDNAAGVDPNSLVVRLDGEEITSTCTLGDGEAVCTPGDRLAGSHRIEAEIQDRVGNLAQVEGEFAISLAIDVAIEKPSNGFLTRDETIDLEGPIETLVRTVEVDGIPGTVNGGRFLVEGVPLHEGANTLTVVARGPDGEIGSATATVVRDTTAPRVVIRSPRTGFVTHFSPITVAGEFVDPTSSSADMQPPEVFVNDLPAEVSGRAFVAEQVYLVPGKNSIRVAVIDAVGNERVASIDVELRSQALQRIEPVGGQGQRGTVGEALDQPFKVRLADFTGSPLPGRPVTFRVSRGDGVLTAVPDKGEEVVVETDAQGVARAHFILGSRSGVGMHEVTATATGFDGAVLFCASAEAGPAQRIVRLAADDPVGPVVGPAGGDALKPFVTQVFDALGNPVSGVEVLYRVVDGGGTILGSMSHATLTDADGQASAPVTLGPEPGVNNHRFEARFAGIDEAPASLILSGVATGPEDLTRLSGLVVDARDEPLPGAKVYLKGTRLETVSGADGRFTLLGVPVGTVDLDVEGATSSRPGPWPHLSFRVTTLSGIDNTLGMPIRLPRLDSGSEKIVGGAEDVVLELDGVPGATLTVYAHSTTFPDGSRTGPMGFTQVPSDRVPMVAPLGSNFMLAWTVQPADVLFDPPARISIPNLGGAPGTVVDIFSFDHDLVEFVPVGTGSVTADGLHVVSDPGFGVIKSGWHGCVPPPPAKTDVCNAKLEKVIPSVNNVEKEAVVAKGDEAVFIGQVRGACTRKAITWDFGDGESAEENAATHVYEEPGSYTATVTVECTSCPAGGTVTESIRVRVVELGLRMQDLPEEREEGKNEEEPGAFLVVNNDDDNDNGTPDFEEDGEVDDEDNLVPLEIEFDSGIRDGEVRLETEGGAGKIRVYLDDLRAEELELPKTWTLAEERPPEQVYVEGVEASEALRSIEASLIYRQNSDSHPITDRILITSVQVAVAFGPEAPFEIPLDDELVYIALVASHQDFENEEDFLPVAEGAEIEWDHLEGGGSLSETLTQTAESGGAAVALGLANQPGDTNRVSAHLVQFKLNERSLSGEEAVEIDANLHFRTGELRVVPGRPTDINLSLDKTSVVTDGTDTVTVTATVLDQYGNAVADGTGISWILEASPSNIVSKQNSTRGGRAVAVIRAPNIPVSQSLRVSSMGVSASTSILVEPVTASLSSPRSRLDLAGETTTLTLTTNAADGTPVFWFASNGQLSSAASRVTDGRSPVELSTDGGRSGPVVVTATVGGRLTVFEGEFFREGALLTVQVDQSFLVGDVPNSGVEPVVWADGSVHHVPYTTSTPVRIEGPANARVSVTDLGFPPSITFSEAYTFESIDDQRIPGLVHGHPLVVDGATLDASQQNHGDSSILFRPPSFAQIDHDEDFNFTKGFRLSFHFRPESLSPSTLVSKGLAWSIELESDGRVRADINTHEGPISVRSGEPARSDWNGVVLEATGRGVRLVLNGAVSQTFSQNSGLLTNDANLSLGENFTGHLDDLAFRDLSQGLGGGAVVEGLDAIGRFSLDETGHGTLWVHSYGGEVPLDDFGSTSLSLGFAMTPDGQAPNSLTLKTVAEEQQTVYFFTKETWIATTDPVLAFLGGDPQTTAGIAANIAGGMLIVGDVGSLVKNTWRMAPWSEKDPNKLEVILSSLGLLTELAVVAGEVPDAGISTARAIIAKIGPSALAALIVKRFESVVLSGKQLLQGEVEFLKFLARNDEAAKTLDEVLGAEEIYEAAVRTYDEFLQVGCAIASPGARLGRLNGRDWDHDTGILKTNFAQCGQAYAQGIQLITQSFGTAISSKSILVLDNISNDLKFLIRDPEQVAVHVATIFQGGKVTGTVSSGLADTELLANVLNNTLLYGSKYDLDEILVDMSKVATLDEFNRLLASLNLQRPKKINHLLGRLYELQVAARHFANGQVQFISKTVGKGKDNTDFDMIDIDLVYYQAKLTDAAINGPNIPRLVERGIRPYPDIKSARVWIEKARKDGAKGIRYILPYDVQLHPKLQEFFDSLDSTYDFVFEFAIERFDLIRD